ncbi:MAG TPA: hypothetical protein VJ860_01060 [Polyangia bacterium]|nr:hypothetical protein [Polyangia bacterium]
MPRDRRASNAWIRVPERASISGDSDDPTYRAQVSFEQASYNQPPHVGFHLGQGMADPPKPNIVLK